MPSSPPPPKVNLTTKRLDTLINSVIERGFDDDALEIDDYSLLMRSVEYRRLVTYQLYDSYFPPKRHEHELQLLTELVEAITSHNGEVFIGESVAAGVLGNAAFALLKHLLIYLVGRLKPLKRSEACVLEMAKNSDKLMQFFKHRKQADLPTISRALNVEGDKIEPLLMLLGFSCRRRGKRRIWIVPETAKIKSSQKRTSIKDSSERW